MTTSDRRSISPKVVLSFLVASLLFSLGFGYFVYVRYIRYVPHASAYLPADATTTLWIDVEQGVVYEPFRQHLLGLLEAGRTGPESRLLHFERKTTIELGVDTRELALAWGPGSGFTAALGGMFRRDGVVRGAARMLADEGREPVVAEDGSFVQVGSRAFFSAQPDGVLLLGATPPRGPAAPSERSRLPAGIALALCWRSEGDSRPCIWVETQMDFPFRLEGSPEAEWPPVLDPALARGALRDLALSEAPDAPRVRPVGTLGRAGFDALLLGLADSFAKQAGPAFDRAPPAR